MFDPIKSEMAQAARKGALGLAASVLLAVGIGFLTVAAWLYLSAIGEPLYAATIIGSAYVGIGLVLFAVVSSDTRPKHAPDQTTRPQTGKVATADTLVEAFLEGMSAGSRAKSNR